MAALLGLPAAAQAGVTFAPHADYETGSRPEFVAADDLNGDGLPDVAVANAGDNTVSVLLNQGNGALQSQQRVATGSGPRSIAVDDVDGDGHADLAVADAGSDAVSVLLGNGHGAFPVRRDASAGSQPSSVAAADFDGDGHADLAVADANSGVVSVLVGNGDGTFQAGQDVPVGSFPLWVVVGQFDGDGHADLAVANFSSATVSVLLGNGDGTFQSPRDFSTGWQPSSVAVADLDGDGRDDLAVADSLANTVSVLLGNGDGTFQERQSFPTGAAPQSVALGDLDGDGHADLAVADYADDTVSVLVGNGDGTFAAQHAFASGSQPFGIAVADLDGDGRLDLVTANLLGTPPGFPDPLNLDNSASVLRNTTPPLTSITAGPPRTTSNPSPSFSFGSRVSGATFECSLAGPGPIAGRYSGCSSPIAYSGLADGRYTFSVRATDASGSVGAAATRSFTVDTKAPVVSITSGPSWATNDDRPSFAFSSEPGATYECRLDGPGDSTGSDTGCASPRTYAGLADGSYTFVVHAKDAAGNVGAATRAFSVDTTPPPVAITSGPSGITDDDAPSFAFDAGEPGATLECRLDGPAGTMDGFAGCTSPKAYSGLADGSYSFSVRATDPVGNTAAATRSFTVDTTKVLRVTTAGAGGAAAGAAGSVTSDPAGVSCSRTSGRDGVGACSASYPRGTSVTLTARPDSADTAAALAGAGCDGASRCTVVMTQAQAVRATFTRDASAARPGGSGGGASGGGPPGGAASPSPSLRAPRVSTGSVRKRTARRVRLTGWVDPRGQATTYRFRFGRTERYGRATRARSAGTGGRRPVAVTVRHLRPGTTYHYRLVVAGPGGVTLGRDRRFTTPAECVVPQLEGSRLRDAIRRMHRHHCILGHVTWRHSPARNGHDVVVGQSRSPGSRHPRHTPVGLQLARRHLAQQPG
jgi:FG-GAP-like repeat/Bacterial Ig-like domain